MTNWQAMQVPKDAKTNRQSLKQEQNLNTLAWVVGMLMPIRGGEVKEALQMCYSNQLKPVWELFSKSAV